MNSNTTTITPPAPIQQQDLNLNNSPSKTSNNHKTQNLNLISNKTLNNNNLYNNNNHGKDNERDEDELAVTNSKRIKLSESIDNISNSTSTFKIYSIDIDSKKE